MRFPHLLASILISVLPLLTGCNRGAHPAQLNIPAPDFTVSDGTSTIHLASYRGHPVLVNFWATWCEPCVVELPSLLQLHRDMPNLTILAVSIDEDPDAYKHFIASRHIDLITVRDPSESAPKLFHTDMWPETYAIDRHGVIRRKFVGAQDWSSPEIRSFLKTL
ncbi:MAG TPA: TlpA disulfide reductase family protein [Terracidiphilus sp.]|nr:TlpA disulfide reductase family protein [Terracidiphilus sp.]